MNKSELKVARYRKGYTQKDVADALGKSETNYRYKENGTVKFSLDEVVKLSKLLGLNLDQVNYIFFDNELHKRQRKLTDEFKDILQ